MDELSFETELPVTHGAIYYIISSSLSLSIWDEKEGNTPANSNLSRGVGSKVYLNTNWSSRDQDRWHISSTGDKPGLYNIKSLCGQYASIPVESTVTRNQVVRLDPRKSSWEIRKNPNADGNDEFYILSPSYQQLGWSYNTDRRRGVGPVLRLDGPPVPWKLAKYNPNPSSTTDENLEGKAGKYNPSPSSTTNETPEGKAGNSGREPCISFGIDIGAATTSVSILNPEGKIQQVEEWFTKFSDSEKFRGVSVPTSMHYPKARKNSRPHFCGAGEPPDPEDYTKVVQFKSDMSKLSTLPVKTKSQMLQHYTDWLEYLFNNVKHISGNWPLHWKRRQAVIVVPNSWDYDQRILLKDAIFEAGWVEKKTNIKFQRECEATLHCLVTNKEAWKPQEVGKAFVVLDAGHINFDVGLFYVKSKSPLQLKEKAGKPPETFFFQGGLQQRNSNNRADNAESPQRRLVEKISRIKKNEKNNLEYLYLAGDPSKNASLLADLKKISGLNIVPIGWQNAAHGALLNRTGNVVAHAIPRSYGVEALVSSDEPKGDMKGRTPISCPNGEFYQFGWSPIIKYELVLEGRTKKWEEYSLLFERKDADLLKFDITVFAADQDADNDWIRDPEGNLNRGFTALFVINADLSELEDKLIEELDDDSDEPYYRLDFGVELVFDSINLEGNVIYKNKKIDRPLTFELV